MVSPSFSAPCLCSLDDFRQPSNPESHRNPLTPPNTFPPTPTIARVSRTPAHHIYIGVIVGFSVGVVILMLVWGGIWFGRKRRKNASPRIFRKSKTNTIDMGFLVERVGANSNVSNVGSAGEATNLTGVVDTRLENGMNVSDSSNAGANGQIGHSADELGSGTASGGVVMMCDDPRLPLVPSRSWGELKLNANGNKTGTSVNGRVTSKPVMSTRNSTNSLCTRNNSSGNLVIGSRSNNNITNGVNMTAIRSTKISVNNGMNNITLCARPSVSTINIARGNNKGAINNSKSINNILGYNNITPPAFNNINKSSGNIAGGFITTNTMTTRKTNNNTNRNSSSTMSTKSTDSSTLSSNESPSVGPFYIKPPANFTSQHDSYTTPAQANSSFNGSGVNFPSQTPAFPASSSADFVDPAFPEYSTPVTYEDTSSSAIYTTPTCNPNRGLPPPTLPPRSIQARFNPPPPPPSTPPPCSNSRQNAQSKGNFL